MRMRMRNRACTANLERKAEVVRRSGKRDAETRVLLCLDFERRGERATRRAPAQRRQRFSRNLTRKFVTGSAHATRRDATRRESAECGARSRLATRERVEAERATSLACERACERACVRRRMTRGDVSRTLKLNAWPRVRLHEGMRMRRRLGLRPPSREVSANANYHAISARHSRFTRDLAKHSIAYLLV